MNKLIKLLALTGLFLPGIALGANTQQPIQTNVVLDQDQRFAIPKDKNAGVADVFNKWAPVKQATFEFSSSTQSIAAGSSGVVDAVCISSGAIGDFVVLYDSVTASWGTSVTPILVSAESAGLGIIAIQRTFPFSASTSAVDGDSNQGCTEFATPLPFSNGLYLQMSAAHSRVFVRYRILRRTGG